MEKKFLQRVYVKHAILVQEGEIMNLNEWAIEALSRRGINVNADGTLDVCFFGDKVQRVVDLDAAIRQQKHIIDQQKVEQFENEEIGKLMKMFHEVVLNLSKMTKKYLKENQNVKDDFEANLSKILEIMSKKKEKLRKDGYERLKKVLKMIEGNNVPAANLASQAALDRMRKRWLVNEKVIDKSLARLEALKQLKKK